MQYGKILPARFLSRPNRFVARVEAEGEELVCHVKNTGSLLFFCSADSISLLQFFRLGDL